MRFMYQTLNLVLHCGPRMNPSRPLAQPLHLRELVVNVHKRAERADDEFPGSWFPYGEVDRYLAALCGTGLLAGLVDKVRITNGTGELVPTLRTESGGVPAYWDRYGFEWGLDVWREP